MKKIEKNKLGYLVATGKYGDGTIYQNNQGEKFKVIGRCEKESNYRYVQFFEHNMQYTTRVRYDHIKNGSVINVYRPTLFGVGYIGEDDNFEVHSSNSEYRTLYEKMMGRCYDKNNNRYHCYGAVGVRVSERWHNWSNFDFDMMNGSVEGSELIQQNKMLGLSCRDLCLDKDIKARERTVEGKGMLYSKDTVKIVTHRENNREMLERKRKSKLKKDLI